MLRALGRAAQPEEQLEPLANGGQLDLHELAQRNGNQDEFEARFARLKTTQARRKGFFDGFKRAMRGG